MADPPDRWLDGTAALARGDLAGARAAYEAVLAGGEDARAHEVLAGVCLGLEDMEASRRHGEAAYRLHRDAGNLCRAAAAAVSMSHLSDWLGHQSATQGWLSRAERLLDEAGPCIERGYLELARAACDVSDVTALEQSAARALAIAREFHDPDLEARALGDSGLALVCQGRIVEGLARLDEAMVAVISGDVREHVVAGLTCCSMLTACERLGDLGRARQWTEAVDRHLRDRFGHSTPHVLQSHCRLVYGHLLSATGSWVDAEAEFRRAMEVTVALPKRAAARGGIAELCLHQGRYTEAEEMLAGLEDRLEVAGALSRLHLARGELDLAAATLERALLALETDLLSSAPLLALHCDTQIERGDLDMAATSAARLRWIAAETGVPALQALARLSSGRVAARRGGPAAEHLRRALTALAGGTSPPLEAEVHLELAGVLRETDPAAAITEARSALAIFDRIGARRGCDRAAALLRDLGAPARAGGGPAGGLDALSRREREVLPLIAEGLSNGDIAARLFITSRTAEHHVSSILAKLGLRSRAEVAARVASQRLAVRP